MLSSIANLWAKKKKDSVGEIVLLIQKYTIIVFLPITLTLVLYSNMIIPLVFGNKFISAAPILTILAFAYMFLAISIVLVYILTAIGSAKQVTYIMLAMSGLAIILNAILIYFKGAIGAAVAVLITNIVLLTLLTLLASKKIIIKPPLVPWIKTVVASGLFFGAIYLARKIFIADVYMKAGACIAIAIVVYVISLFLLKVLTAKELRYFKKMF
jgi:O-antigen/teichoic acid export membrane protein